MSALHCMTRCSRESTGLKHLRVHKPWSRRAWRWLTHQGCCAASAHRRKSHKIKPHKGNPIRLIRSSHCEDLSGHCNFQNSAASLINYKWPCCGARKPSYCLLPRDDRIETSNLWVNDTSREGKTLDCRL